MPRMFVMDQYIHDCPAVLAGEGSTNLHVSQMRTDENLAPAATHLLMQPIGIDDIQSGKVDFPLPAVQLVQQGMSKSQVLAIDGCMAREQSSCWRAGLQVTLILGNATARPPAEDIEVDHSQPNYRSGHAPAQP